jgi:ribosomal protein L10
MKRSVRDFSTNWVTTITGIILAVTVLLTSLGVITPEQSGEIQTQSQVILTSVGNVIGAVSALILIFKAKD